MQDISLTKTRLIGGVWEGILQGAGASEPTLKVTHMGEAVTGWSVTHDPKDDTWLVQVPVPLDRIADGVQTFIISEAETDTQLASFAMLSGEGLAEDIRAEMDLLRAELDMLKKAFRRHCVETT